MLHSIYPNNWHIRENGYWITYLCVPRNAQMFAPMESLSGCFPSPFVKLLRYCPYWKNKNNKFEQNKICF